MRPTALNHLIRVAQKRAKATAVDVVRYAQQVPGRWGGKCRAEHKNESEDIIDVSTAAAA